ncbi:hypothetical protein GYMLUDRAFT_536676 [Collybiopsis luxurians FD-317 M1]|nr:hypothetical protein GYMLUDRAFT_536676 [Collybiopsis luxurians FD-317 M1]
MIDILNEIISVGRLTIPPNEPPPSVDLDQDLVKKTDSSLELSNGTVGFPPASFSSLDSDNGQLDAQGFFQKTHPLPFNSNELGLLPLYSSDLTAFPQIPPSAYRSAEDVHSMLSRSDIMYPASANSATLADLGALGIGINFDSNYSSSPSNGPTDAHSRIPSATNHFFHQAEMPASPWGSLSDNTSAYSALDSGESGKDWTLFMRNVDELLRSASTDFRMTVDEA